MEDERTIKENLNGIRRRIGETCLRAGRNPAEVKLLLATKTVAPERIASAIKAGATLIGENRVQEFRDKNAALSALDRECHFIGHLQTNKVKEVLKYVTCIHSIDSLHLAQKLNDRLQFLQRTLEVFVQVNTSFEKSKFGVSPNYAPDLIKQVSELENLRVRGLMTIGTLFATGERARRCFRLLRGIRDEIAVMAIPGVDLRELSMGMTPDFEEAILEGATIVRIGSAIFGGRPTPDGFFWDEKDRP